MIDSDTVVVLCFGRVLSELRMISLLGITAIYERIETMIEPEDRLLNPIQLRIVQALVGDPMTPLQLNDRLGDVPQATLYRDSNLWPLAGCGGVGERQIREESSAPIARSPPPGARRRRTRVGDCR